MTEKQAPTRRASSDRARATRDNAVRKPTARHTTGTSRGAYAGRASQGASSAQARSGGFLRGYRGILIGAIAVLALWVAVVLCDCAVNGNRIYQGVHVGTVDVSGMTVDEASTAIAEAYNPVIRSSETTIYADEATRTMAANGTILENLQESENVSADEAAEQRKFWTVNAEELQAHVDADGLAQLAYQAGREEGGVPARMSAQTFGWQIDPKVVMNDAAVETLASSIDRAIGDVHEDFDVVVEDGYAAVTEGHPGREVDPAALQEQIGQQFLGTSSEQGIVAVAVDTPVNIDKNAAQAVADQINDGIAQGATFNFEGTTWQATPYDLGNLIVTKAEKSTDGTWQLIPAYDEYEAKSTILANLQSTYSKQNVKVEFVEEGDGIMVTTDASGTMPEVGEALGALESQTLGAKPSSTPVITVLGSQIPSKMSIESAMDYGIITKISSFETEYTEGTENRNTNIHLAADLINNSIVKANGGVWSFNDTTGECNEEKGFKGAGAIVDGEIVDDVGGGICQVATTVFNAVFESGLPVDSRSNHSLYIASYPAGRDAAVDYPDLDLIWHNDTNCDVLLQTSWTDSTVTVDLLGVDPGYTVESKEGDFKDGAKHGVRTEVDSKLEKGETEVKQSGVDGSSITVTRTVKDSAGNVVRTDRFDSVYDAQDEIILIGPGTDIDVSSLSQDSDDEAEEYYEEDYEDE